MGLRGRSCALPDGTATHPDCLHEPHWYALHTKPRHERRIGVELRHKGFQIFVPTVKEVHRWSDRRKIVEVPLFSCYVFFRANNVVRARETVFLTPGIFRVVGAKDRPTPIPDSEIQAFQRLVAKGVPMANSLFLGAGQRVRIRGGVLDRLEGILQSDPGDDKILVSIELIQRAVSVSLEGYDIEPA